MIAPKKVFFDCRSIIQCKQVFTMAFATPGRYPHCFVSTNVCGHRVCVSMYILVGVYIVVHKMMINEWNDAVRTSTHKTIRDLFTRFHVFRVAHVRVCVCRFCLSRKSFGKCYNCNVVKVYFQFLSEAHKHGLTCIFISHRNSSKVSLIAKGTEKKKRKAE